MATLENKTILILGGSSGIGFSVAAASLKSLAQLVIVASSSKDKIENAVKRLTDAKLGPGLIRGHVVDARNEQALKALLEEVGEIDHIVFTANGQLADNFMFPGIDINTAKGMMDVGVWGAVAVAKYAKFRPGGSFTFTSGIVALRPFPTFAVPSALGGTLLSLTKGLAVDLAPVRVNVICPGAVETELWDHFPKEAKDGMLSIIEPKILVKHIGMPDEVAEAYLFCMKCTFITGQYIVVDGGQLLG